MDLQTFVSNSLNQILTAVVQSQRFVRANNLFAEIAPTDLVPAAGAAGLKVYDNGSRSTAIDVTFDVAVTTSDEQTAKAGAGIKVVGLGLALGAGAEKLAANSAVSRISFRIPVILPDPGQVSVARLPETGEA